MPSFQKPLLPSCFLTWSEPPDESGDERFRIVSWRRILTLKGHSFREFARSVVPMLDGKHTLDDICASNQDIFDRPDLESALETLGAQGIIVESVESENDLPQRLAPQLNYFSETCDEGRAAQKHLGKASVVIFGMGGAGAPLARMLGAAGVGHILCVDSNAVGPTDLYFSGLFNLDDIGNNRAETVIARINCATPETELKAVSQNPDKPEQINALIKGADLVISCLESGELNLMLKLNRACIESRRRWLSGALEGPEIVVGPGFPVSKEGPCYMCYRMRNVACAVNPESGFGLERKLDRMKQDMSERRENLACGADILAGFLGTEAVNVLTGASLPALDGRLLVIDLPSLRQTKHVVLRKPDCPVCGAKNAHE